jgi:predicted DsbA family dithiol-disulfide isomerase
VYYDYICPFCYLGSKRMETLAKEFDLDIEWIDLFYDTNWNFLRLIRY